MAFIPVPNVIMGELFMTLDSQRIENTLYFETPSAPTVSNLATVNSIVANLWILGLAPLLSQDITGVATKATDLTSAISPASEVTFGSPVSGSVGQESMPGNVALCVSFRTLFRGRSARGRNYVAGIPTTALTLNTFSSVFTDAVIEAYQDMSAAADSEGLNWCVVSRYTGGAPRTEGVAFTINTVRVVDLIADSQRRRLPGRGV